MNKKRYIVPFCRISVLDSEMLVATSEKEFNISNTVTEQDADLSNIKRPDKGSNSIWDKGW